MIKYKIETFLKVESSVKDKINVYGNNLKQNTLKKLLIQSKSKKDIEVNNESENTNTKKSNVWVSKSLNFNENKIDNATKLNQILNKLTDKNKNKLFLEVLNIINLDNQLTNNIYIKSKEQDYYSEIFAELCRYVFINLKNNDKFLEILLNNVESDFKNRFKNYSYGNILFLSNLNKHKLISSKVIDLCIIEIISNINKDDFDIDIKDSEVNSLYNLINITKNKVDLKTYKLLKSLSEDKLKIKNSKSRFKLLDIMELLSL
jgi:hypothetical protein